MDKKVEILLNSAKNIETVNVDTYDKVELQNKPSLLLEYDIRNVLSATEVFDVERQANPIYRIYGKIEYMSLLNGLKNGYDKFEDFFNPQKDNSKNILNSFDFYLVKASTGYTDITNVTTEYLRYFEVIATPDEFELYPVGFANNVYGEQAYAFEFNIDFDITTYHDDFGFPATELFLYVQYKTTGLETIRRTEWSTVTGDKTHINPEITTKTLNIGDYVETQFDVKLGDKIEYSEPMFYQDQLSPQTFYIRTPYFEGSTPRRLEWKYNPFIPFRLRYLSNELYRANTGNTVYEQVQSIPYYATPIDSNGNYVWRNILEQGYIDPLTDVGVDYPFVNKRRYLYSNIILDVVPNLLDLFTLGKFQEVWYSRNAETIDETPMGDINDIGKPCQ